MITCSSSVVSPPTPPPMTTPQRAGSVARSPASATASAAAAMPSCDERSSRRASLRGTYAATSKSRTSQPNLTARSSVSISVSGAAAETPDASASQHESTSQPAGVFTPKPVTATRTLPLWSRAAVIGASPNLGEHHVDRVPDGGDAFQILFGNLDVEALLEPHHELDEVEAVGVEIFLETSRFGDRVGLDTEHLDGNVTDRVECLGALHCMSSWDGWDRADDRSDGRTVRDGGADSVPHAEAAVDGEQGARHVARSLGAQERDGARAFLDGAEATERNGRLGRRAPVVGHL